MSSDSHSDEAIEAEGNSLPVGEPVSTPSFEQTIPPAPQQQVAVNNQRDQAERAKRSDPLVVRIIEDDELSSFEQKTVKFGRWGLIVASFSFAAASAAAYFVYQQFAEMNAQTQILSATAERARIDSNDNAKATAAQLASFQAQIGIARREATVMQGQLAEARRSADIAARQLDTSQRAWIDVTGGAVVLLKFSPGGGLSLNTKLTYMNVGNLPAIGVHIAGFVFLLDQTGDLLQQAKTLQKMVCERGRQNPDYFRYTIKQTIYPDETKDVWLGEGMRTDGKGMVGADGRMQPVIVGCVYYKYSSSLQLHETPFIFDIHEKLERGSGDIRLGKELKPEDILLSDFWKGEAETDHP